MRLYQMLLKIIHYRFAHAGLTGPGLPLVLTFSVTNRCNSRCKTCNIWKNSNRANEELKLDEIEKIFKSLGKLYFLNISGGEPFLRTDLVDIINLGQRYSSPNLIHIPTNGLLTNLIEKRVKEILQTIPKKTFLTIKLSLDGVGDTHDFVRGIPGNFSKMMETYSRLDRIRKEHTNFHLGFNTITSKFNLEHLDETIEFARSKNPDSYVTEVAENRSEMFNLNDDITPDAEAYSNLILSFRESTKQNLKGRRSISKYTEASRLVYYDYVVRILAEKRQVLPCYAGLSNAHLNPFGEVWPCCILGYSQIMGNVRDFNCNFKELWNSHKAKQARAYIKAGKCYCPMANQFYSNMLCNTRAMAKVAKNLLVAK